MKILLLTSSARGHAIAETLARSRHMPAIINICPNRNPGIRRLAAEQYVMDIMDFPAVLEIAKQTKPDFAFIGPDDPIGGGIVDALESIGVPSVAPTKDCARIESSKGFARELMRKHGIDASPRFRVFETTSDQIEPIRQYIVGDLRGEYVVKYDALKGGKGVKVSGEHLHSIDQGVAYALECMQECGRVVIEEKLIGVEFSLMSFTSGKTTIDMPAVQDHKRACDGDTGPNTGGMGTYSDANHSLPFLTAQDLARASEVNRLVAAALMKECPEHVEGYKGILYGGFMAVRDGVRVIEYNARFGDPEALNILPLLETDFVDLSLAIINGELKPEHVRFARKATVCKYITPASYPEAKTEKGRPIVFPHPLPENGRLYVGDISEDDDGTFRLGGSRTAGIVGIADTIADAESIAENLCEQVKGPVRFRKDIGTAELVKKRVETMKQIRST
ncbi:MAG: phosphoribosylamine/glycine ligase [Candidatus Peregrinibacteria bacterium Greene0416_19]|nr:MAG: phosphoribosylamine/glycine ligase [Candidatus Peregrinibacteria bacterium Greene0416_19]